MDADQAAAQQTALLQMDDRAIGQPRGLDPRLPSSAEPPGPVGLVGAVRRGRGAALWTGSFWNHEKRDKRDRLSSRGLAVSRRGLTGKMGWQNRSKALKEEKPVRKAADVAIRLASPRRGGRAPWRVMPSS